MYYVYVLYSRIYDRLYTGFSSKLTNRIKEHKTGRTFAGSKLKDFELVYYEACLSKKDAQTREKQLKTGFGRGYLRKRLKNYLRTVSSVG